jgi:hypothetical protein
VADQHRPGLGPDRRSLRAPTLPEALNKYRRHSFMVGADRSALTTAANRKTRSAGLEVRHFAAKDRTLQDRPGPIKEPAADAFGG